MGHDIYGYNKAGEEIAYARFSMGSKTNPEFYTKLFSDSSKRREC